MKANTRKLMDNETPFKVIQIGDIEIRQYWTAKGVYGHQVLTCIFGMYPEFHEYKTSGCGYDKSASGLEWAWRILGKRPFKVQENDSRMNAYHIGGNFYQVPVNDVIYIKDL